MKKSGLLILMSFFIIGNLCAVGATRIYGNVEAGTEVKLTLTYTANGEKIEGQTISRASNNIGDWEYRINTDDGAIELKVNYKDIEKEFSVPTGQDFEVLLFDDATQTAAQTNVNTSDEDTNTSTNTSEQSASSEETNNSSDEEDDNNKSNISGNAVSESSENKISLGNKLTLLIIAIGLFVLVFIANILSSLVLESFKKRIKRNRAEMPIRVVKLSEKLDEAKRQLEKAQQEIKKNYSTHSHNPL